jgi:hypothetical protein
MPSLGRAAEAHAAPHRGRPPRAGALLDQRPLELGDAGEHGQHHPPGRAGGVGPGLAQRAQAGAGLAQLLGDPQQVAGRAGQAVEAGDHGHVALARLVEQAGELRPVAPGAGELLLVDPPAAGLLERGALQGEVLVVGAGPGAAEEHGGGACRGCRRGTIAFRDRHLQQPDRPDLLARVYCRVSYELCDKASGVG